MAVRGKGAVTPLETEVGSNAADSVGPDSFQIYNEGGELKPKGNGVSHEASAISPARAVGTVEAPPPPGKSSDHAVDTVDSPVELAKATGLVVPPLPEAKNTFG